KAISPPPTVRAITISASPLNRMRSGETSSTCRAIASAPARKFRRRLAGQRRRSRCCSSSKAGKRIPSSSRLASDAADSAIHPPDSRAGALCRFPFLLLLGRQGPGLLAGALGVADVEEGLLGQVVEVAVHQLLER